MLSAVGAVHDYLDELISELISEYSTEKSAYLYRLFPHWYPAGRTVLSAVAPVS
jgi:hypothetical protein